jgi:hypothetical protein
MNKLRSEFIVKFFISFVVSKMSSFEGEDHTVLHVGGVLKCRRDVLID